MAEMAGVGAEEDQVFADEAVQHGQSEGGEHGKKEEGRETRHGRGKTAVLGDFERMPTVVEHPDEEKERSGGDAVREHLIDRALHTDGVEREDAENNKAQVADGRISDK